jgi:hypothetical protein
LKRPPRKKLSVEKVVPNNVSELDAAAPGRFDAALAVASAANMDVEGSGLKIGRAFAWARFLVRLD